MTDKNVKSSRFSRRRLFGSAAFTTAGLAVCFLVLVGKPQTQPTQFPEPRRPLVDVILAAPADHSISVRTQGTVEPNNRRREKRLLLTLLSVTGESLLSM